MKIFNRLLDWIMVAFIGLFVFSFTHWGYQITYLIGYVFCTWFWIRHVDMTKFEAYTVGLVWPMAMIHYVFMVLAYRYMKKHWVFNFTSVKYAMEQRRLHENI